MKKYIVDRFEENFVVLEKENGGTTDVPKTLLPEAKPGDVVLEKDGKFFANKKETEKRKVSVMRKFLYLSGKK